MRIVEVTNNISMGHKEGTTGIVIGQKVALDHTVWLNVVAHSEKDKHVVSLWHMEEEVKDIGEFDPDETIVLVGPDHLSF